MSSVNEHEKIYQGVGKNCWDGGPGGWVSRNPSTLLWTSRVTV
jgi:hypothetical protein